MKYDEDGTLFDSLRQIIDDGEYKKNNIIINQDAINIVNPYLKMKKLDVSNAVDQGGQLVTTEDVVEPVLELAVARAIDNFYRSVAHWINNDYGIGFSMLNEKVAWAAALGFATEKFDDFCSLLRDNGLTFDKAATDRYFAGVINWLRRFGADV